MGRGTFPLGGLYSQSPKAGGHPLTLCVGQISLRNLVVKEEIARWYLEVCQCLQRW